MRSAPSSTALAAQAPASLSVSPQAACSSADQSVGSTSTTSAAITGRLGIAPSKCRKGSVASPPTVTVVLRVPPSAVAPRVISRTFPGQVSFGISTTVMWSPSLFADPSEERVHGQRGVLLLLQEGQELLHAGGHGLVGNLVEQVGDALALADFFEGGTHALPEVGAQPDLSLIHISEPTRRTPISYAV